MAASCTARKAIMPYWPGTNRRAPPYSMTGSAMRSLSMKWSVSGSDEGQGLHRDHNPELSRRPPEPGLADTAHQQLTRDRWEFRDPAFDLYVSEPVLEEAAAGDAIPSKQRLGLLADIRVLALTEDALKL